jgi:DNA-binding response OmpR family regulator
MSDPEARPLILVVEDDASVMRSVTSALAFAGFRVLAAQDGDEGLQEFIIHADEIALVLADIAMPKLGGIRMSEEILRRRPDSRILLMTGYSDNVLGAGSLKLPLIRKPFLPSDLVRKIKALLTEGAREAQR